MAIRYLANLDIGTNQLLNASLQQIATDPVGFEGQIIYNTTDNVLKYYDGSSWIALDGTGDITRVDITAGNGLSGTSVNTTSGAHIQTLTVGQGTGINVNASSVAVDSTVVRTTGTQTIGGAKTFTTIPIVGTASISDDSTKAASTAWVNDQGYVESLGGNVGANITNTIGGTTAVPIISSILNATGTAGASTYLRGDNSWAALPTGYTSFTLQGNTAASNAIIDGDRVVISGGTGLSSILTTVGTLNTLTVNLDDTSVNPGIYTSANITIDQQGRITVASSGASGTMSSFDVAGDVGTAFAITEGNTLTIDGGDGIVSTLSAVDTVSVGLDIASLTTSAAFAPASDFIPFNQTGSATNKKTLSGNISLSAFGVPTANVAWGSNKITSLLNPTAAQDAATKDYVDSSVAGSGALIYQGAYDAATNTPNLDATPTITINKGFTYTVTVAGLFYTEQVEVGDLLIAEVDTPTTLSDWTTVQNNIDIASATTVGIASFPTAGGLAVTVAGAVSLPTLGAILSVGAVSKTLTATIDIKGRVTALADTDILITTSQISDFTSGTTGVITAREYVATIGDGVLLTHTVTHNLGTRDVMVSLYDTTAFNTVFATVVRTSTNAVSISTSAAIATGGVRVLVKEIG
tara:strand:- start:17939 stop:19849 length:1911 start_codon:yes stop_codon:yes gene_type:complete